VASVTIAAGQITATYNNTNANKAIRGDNFILSAVTSAGSISWTCTKGNVPTQYLPTSCRTGA